MLNAECWMLLVNFKQGRMSRKSLFRQLLGLDVLTEVLFVWCDLNSKCKLDSAAISKDRTILLNILSNPIPVTATSWCDGAYKWVILRELRLSEVCVQSYSVINWMLFIKKSEILSIDLCRAANGGLANDTGEWLIR